MTDEEFCAVIKDGFAKIDATAKFKDEYGVVTGCAAFFDDGRKIAVHIERMSEEMWPLTLDRANTVIDGVKEWARDNPA